MSTPILATKIYVPPPPPKIVPRAQLIARLNAGLHRKLTLISAPAGFGKSTLVSEWVAGCGRPVAWLSLDEGDSDLTRFFTGLIAAVQTIAPQVGAGLLGVIQSPQPPSTGAMEAILTALLNEMAAIPNPFIVVLDDYHVIDSQPIDQALTFLIEHLPSQIHWVIATREDPHLPLARLRVRGQLAELRVTDLRFTPAEAAEFLNPVMGLDIAEVDIAALETRTEGWIAGLQLAALALQGLYGRQDAHNFIQSFTGSHRFVLDYLVEEVLLHQPKRVQTFLLRTAILDRLCGPLCDAVTLDPAMPGQATLNELEYANLFVIPLDNERRWYRYHHLFADLLRQRLHQQGHPSSAASTGDAGPDVAELHLRASRWYEHAGSSVDSIANAIRHAFAAEDFERAANLVEREWPILHRNHFRSAMTLGWMKALPDALVRARPVLSVGYAWELLNSGALEAAETRLRDAERWLERTAEPGEQADADAAGMVVVDEAEFRALPASIATARAYQAMAHHDVPATVAYARRALDLLPAEDGNGRGPAAALLGLAYWASGDLETAYRALADGMAGFQRVGNILFAISGTYGLADIRIAQGRLRDAIDIYEQTLQLALAQGEPVLQGTADLYLGLSELHREQGNLEAAAKHLLTSETLGEPAALPDWPYRLGLAQARVRQAQGDLDGTLDRLDTAARLYVRGPVPDVRPIAALKARVWVAQGHLTQALGWVQARGLSVEDDLDYLREFEHITLARVLIAQYQSHRPASSIGAAIAFLARLLQAAEAGGRTGSVIEISVLQALAHAAQDDVASALLALERALTLAEPEGYVRIFVGEGPAMAALLQTAAQRGIAPNYVSRLRTAFGAVAGSAPVTQALSAQPVLAAGLLDEPLSQRELDVLRLLGTELNGPDMARELQVSLNTLRTHTKNIFSKLGVNSRRAAVRRAEELGLG